MRKYVDARETEAKSKASKMGQSVTNDVAVKRTYRSSDLFTNYLGGIIWKSATVPHLKICPSMRSMPCIGEM